MLALLKFLKLNRKKIQFLIINLSLIFIFALIYWLCGTQENFKILYSEPNLSYLDALYFSFITHSTIGYGDIVPISPLMRCITILQTICIFAYIFLITL